MSWQRSPWPVTLRHGTLSLRPLRRRDRDAWEAQRAHNHAWLTPWAHDDDRPDRDRLVGLLSLGGIQYGSVLSGSIGYWIDRREAGRGLTPTAVAMAADWAFRSAGLHRVEVNIRPENAASLRVVEKLGLRDEGVRRSYLHVDGDWRDHRTFAITAEEVPEGLLARWLASRPRA